MAAVTNAIIVIMIAMIAMHFKFVIRKTMLLFGFPKIEPLHPELAKYQVGALKIRLAQDLPTVQLFYPVARDAKRANNDFVSYFRPQAVQGLLKFLETGESADGVLQFLQDAKHPNWKYYAADPSLETKFPLILFSHGLSGTIELYSQLCSQLASLGCIVVAPEHADSSASYATRVLEDGSVEEVWYRPPNSLEPYSRDKMVRYRGPHLELRVQELTELYHFLKGNNKVSYMVHSQDDVRIANAVLDSLDAMNLHLVGHSFGASTQLLSAQTWAKHRLANTTTTNDDDTIVPLTITLCDTWNFALSKDIVAQGIPKTPETCPPILSVISHEWVPNPEVEPLKEFLRQSQPQCSVDSYYAKDSVHQSFSDTQSWMPNKLAETFENRGVGEDRHVTIRAVVSAFSKHTGIGDGTGTVDALVEYPIDK